MKVLRVFLERGHATEIALRFSDPEQRAAKAKTGVQFLRQIATALKASATIGVPPSIEKVDSKDLTILLLPLFGTLSKRDLGTRLPNWLFMNGDKATFLCFLL